MHIVNAAPAVGNVRVRHSSVALEVRDGTIFRDLDSAILGVGLNVLRWDERAGRNYVDDHWWPGSRSQQVRFFDECGLEVPPPVVRRSVVRLARKRRRAWQKADAKIGQRYDPDRFRSGPVPHTGGRGRWRHLMRTIPTRGEHRHADAVARDEACVELGISVRAKRRGYNLRTSHDDVVRSDYRDCGWKSHRKTQWRAFL